MLYLILGLLILPAETLKSLIEKSYVSSPFVKQIDANLDILEDAKGLVKSYHYPTLSFTQGLYNSNNPLSVFAFKLEEASITQADFNPTLLNNPNDRTTNKSSLTLKIPIYTAGQLSYKEEALSLQKKSVEEQKKFIKKVLRKNIYGLYYALVNLNEFQNFLDVELKYLETLLSFYDAKTAQNQNRYLSYNKGKIIKVTIEEAKLEILKNKNVILENIKYISGIEDLSLVNIDVNSEDIFKNKALESFKNSSEINREDLEALKFNIESIAKDLASDKGKFIPNLGAFANYSINSEDFNSSDSNYTVGLILSWDLGFNNFKNLNLSNSKLNLAKIEYDNKKEELSAEFIKTKETLLNLDEKIKKIESKHQIYLENKKILSSQYQKGSMDLYNLLDNFAYYIENRGLLSSTKAEQKMAFVEFINLIE